jgi:hypothetical protein
MVESVISLSLSKGYSSLSDWHELCFYPLAGAERRWIHPSLKYFEVI